MRCYDLTRTICADMPVYPGTEKPKLEPACSCEKDGFQETKICMYSHTGTHIDPPAHLFNGKMTLDRFPIEQFIGKALVIDCTEFSDEALIPLCCLEKYGNLVEQADFLLFRMGFDEKWGNDSYFENYPCLSFELLEFIIDGDYKGIGFDVISLDPIHLDPLARHKRLFSKKQMINIENLCNLDVFGNELFMFSCFPIKIENSDGAPCRAVGWFIE